MLLKNILITTCLISLISLPAISQQSAENTESEYELAPRAITIDKFDCFQTLQCLKRENPFKKSNLDNIRINDNRSSRFIVEGSSKNETLHAVYTNSGELVKATVIQRNIPMPRTINEALVTGEYKSWTVIGNELVIENFDKERMQYKVILENEGEVRVEYFDRNGHFLNRIS